MKVLKDFIKQYKTESTLVLLAIALSLLAFSLSGPTLEVHSTGPQSSLDTYIPKGFTLIPIVIKNISQISALVGSYAVVSVFESGNTKFPIVEGIKIIRSPKDPSYFALLSPQNKSSIILNSKPPYYITILNPQHNINKFRTKKHKKSKRIEVGI